MAVGLNTHYHLMLAVINAFSLLVLSTDIMMASLSLPLCFSVCLYSKLSPSESCLRLCHITRLEKIQVFLTYMF